MKKMRVPKIKRDVYVGSSYYIDHGEDDFEGGLCKIKNIEKGRSAGKDTLFVELEERPGHSYNWDYLMEHQEEWAKEFKDRRGYPDPDYGNYGN
jgi:hypothetical protein